MNFKILKKIQFCLLIILLNFLVASSQFDSLYYYSPDSLEEVFYIADVAGAAVHFDLNNYTNIKFSKLKFELPELIDKLNYWLYFCENNNASPGNRLDSIYCIFDTSSTRNCQTIDISEITLPTDDFWIVSNGLCCLLADPSESGYSKVFLVSSNDWSSSNDFGIKFIFEAEKIVAIEDNDILQPQLLLDIFPNPFNSSTIFRINIAEAGQKSEINIVDIRGNLIESIAFPQSSCEYSYQWHPANDLATGIYFVTLKSEYNYVNKKLLYLK